MEVLGNAYAAEEVAAESITVDKEKIELAYGESISAGIKTVPEKAAEDIAYTTSNMAVAMVTSDGKVYGNGAGNATITATTADGKKVSVKVRVTELAVTPGSGIWVGAGETDGVVHTKKSGYVRITAVGENGYKGSAVVHVRKAPYRFSVKPKKSALKVGQTKQIRYELPAGCCASKAAYKSSNSAIAAVSSTGLIRAKKAGSCTITVKLYNGKRQKIPVTVK